jgi:hypothetical protein
MTINLEVLEAAFIYDKNEIIELKTKELVPKMVTRRRLTRAAKIAIYLADAVNFKVGRIIYGSSFGEIPATANILKSIKDNENISPTDFQNSVYNTAASYLSMLYENKNEIMTLSSGDKTSQNLLKSGAIKALDGDEILLIGTETLNIPNINEVNNCIDYLESGVALKVKVTQMSPNIDINRYNIASKIPKSLKELFSIAQQFDATKQNIIEIKI